jgi:hypothetical protein
MGIDHRHAYGMTEHLIAAGATCAGWWTEGSPETEGGFRETLSRIFARVADYRTCSTAPISTCRHRGHPAGPGRAGHRGDACGQGCDGRQTRLHHARAAWRRSAPYRRKPGASGPSISPSGSRCPPSPWRKRWCVDGAIGRVVQTVGLGPHRLNRATRPGWFFERDCLWRHPDRYREPPDRPVPAFHRLEDAEITMRRWRITPIPAIPGFRISARSRSGPTGPGLYPRRLVHARCAAQLGRRAPDDPGHRGLHRTAEICGCRRTRRNGHADPRQRRTVRGHRCAAVPVCPISSA